MKRKVGKLAFWIIIPLLVAYCAAEWYLSLRYRNPGSESYRRQASQAFYRRYEKPLLALDPDKSRFDRELFSTMKPGEYTEHTREFNVTYSFNSAGLRDDEASLTAPEIILIGDGQTLGRGVAKEDTFAGIIERESGKKVLNAGVDGYGTVRELIQLGQLDRSALKFLVIQINADDLQENINFKETKNRRPVFEPKAFDDAVRKALKDRSPAPGKYLRRYRRLLRRYEKKEARNPELDSLDVARSHTFHVINALKHASVDFSDLRIILFEVSGNNQNNTKFYQAMRAMLRSAKYGALDRELDIESLDLAPLLSEEHYHVLDEHLNVRGHREVASAVLQAMQHDRINPLSSHEYLGEFFPASASLIDESPSVPEDFAVDVVYRVPRKLGSWICLAVDDRGRLIAGNERDGFIYRLNLPAQEGKAVTAELIVDRIPNPHGLLFAFDSLYGTGNTSNTKLSGLYRVPYLRAVDRFGEHQRITPIYGVGAHGSHAVVLSPDGKGLHILGGNETPLPKFEPSRVPRPWAVDRLISVVDSIRSEPGYFRKNGPGGWIARTDPDGSSYELLMVGLRNPFDFAFNADGEMFTCESDSEWNIGNPWYRPVRMYHLLSGGDYGWRPGPGKWPDWYPDTVPSIGDIGQGSPTGMTFGYGARLPGRYQRTLFVGDWSRGMIYAVHLEPDGASYQSTIEVFLSGAPLPVVDMVVNPADGHLYFLVGGRGTSSAIYRIRYTGSESTAPVELRDTAFAEARRLRRSLEAFHGTRNEKAIDTAWPHLSSRDIAIRHAARIAVEHQPVNTWKDRALSETNANTLITASLALVRCSEPGRYADATVQALGRITWEELSESDRRDLCRVYQLVISRSGTLAPATRQAILDRLDPRFPADTSAVNLILAEILTALDAPGLMDRLLTQLDEAPVQADRTFYAFLLSDFPEKAWTEDQHRHVFDWHKRARQAGGGVMVNTYLNYIREQTLDKLSDARKAALGNALWLEPAPNPMELLGQRTSFKAWTVDELLPEIRKPGERDLLRGRQVFTAGLCFQCHRFKGEGGLIGPDLTTVTSRFDHRTLLESILEPSKVISDQYNSVTVQLKNGESITGHLADISGQAIILILDMLDPSKTRPIPHAEIKSIEPTKVSTMPPTLINHFTAEEIRNMISFMKSGSGP